MVVIVFSVREHPIPTDQPALVMLCRFKRRKIVKVSKCGKSRTNIGSTDWQDGCHISGEKESTRFLVILSNQISTLLKTLSKFKVDTCVILEKGLLSEEVTGHLTLHMQNKGKMNQLCEQSFVVLAKFSYTISSYYLFS